MRVTTLLAAGLCGAIPVLTMAAEAQLEEIVVTAQKREQSLNDVALTVDALTGEALRDKHIDNMEDLSHAIAGFTYAESQWGTPVLTLRGVGYSDTSLAASPAVTAYLDQAPLSFPALVSHVNFDLERVEVLKGPQGTLFGQNSTGGAINFIAAKPTNTFTAGETVTYGRFNAVTQEGFVSGPISDTVSVRFAERTETADGWQRSVSLPGDSNGSVNNRMGRVVVDFHPYDGMNWELNINGWQDQSQPQAAQYVGINLQHGPTLKPAILDTEPFAPANDQAADWNAGLPRRDNSMYQIALRGDVALPHDLTLSSISSYIQYNRDEAIDWAGVPAPINYNLETGNITTFSQELRIANNQRDQFRWTIGGNYEHDSIFQLYQYHYNDSSTALALPGVDQNDFDAAQISRTAAAFANTEFDFAPGWSAKAGARFTQTDLSVNECGYDYTPPYAIGDLFYEILAAHPGPYPPGGCFPINNLGYAKDGVAAGDPGRFTDEFDQNNVSWQVGLNYKPEPGMLFYANVSKGYKAGIFPITGTSVWKEYLPLTQESLMSYEPGFKLTLLDDTMQLNGDVYYYDYSDKQIRSRVIDPIFGDLDALQNIPKSSAKGAELELQYRPVPPLTLGLAASYMDATITQFSGINGAGVTANFSGTQMPFSPKFTVNGSADYVFPVSGSTNMFMGATVTYRSSSCAIIGCETNPPNATPNNITLFLIDSYTLVDLRLGLKTDTWQVSLWGKNVFNTYYWNDVNPSFDVVSRYAGMPATYGITASYKVH